MEVSHVFARRDFIGVTGETSVWVSWAPTFIILINFITLYYLIYAILRFKLYFFICPLAILVDN